MFLSKSKKLNLSVIALTLVLSAAWWMDAAATDSPIKMSDGLPPVTIEEGNNLRADGKLANKKQIPVLLFFSMEHCPFCREVEEDYLKPMLRNAEYDSKVIIRKVRLDSEGKTIDFKGKAQDTADVGARFNVSMVPTLVLVDSQGNKVSAPIIGIANSHYYSAELDIAIENSTQKIKTLAKR